MAEEKETKSGPTLTREQVVALNKSSFFTQLGKSGVYIKNGVISKEEYKKELTGKEGLKTYNEMRSSDGTCRAALMAVTLPVLAANYYMQSASDSPSAMLAQQLCHVSMFDNVDFDDFGRQALTFLPFGFSLFEQEFVVGTVEGKEYMLLKDMHFRKQTSLKKWVMSNGEPGIEQFLQEGGSADIPEVKITRFTFEQEGDNYEGRSILRAAYKHWYMKTAIELVDGMAHEKQGLGILKVQVPPGTKQGDKDEAEDIAREQRSSEEGHILEEEGFRFEFMDMKANTTRDPVNSLQYHNRQILLSVLAQLLEIGSKGSSGSFAASDNQLDLFFMSVESIAKEFVASVNKTVIPNICILNGIKPEDYPTLAYDRIGSDAINVLSDALNKLFVAGALTPDPEIEQYIRRFLHMPEMTEDMIKRYDEIRAVRRNPSSNPQQVPPNVEDTKEASDAIAASALIGEARKMRDKLRKFASESDTRTA